MEQATHTPQGIAASAVSASTSPPRLAAYRRRMALRGRAGHFTLSTETSRRPRFCCCYCCCDKHDGRGVCGYNCRAVLTPDSDLTLRAKSTESSHTQLVNIGVHTRRSLSRHGAGDAHTTGYSWTHGTRRMQLCFHTRVKTLPKIRVFLNPGIIRLHFRDGISVYCSVQ